MARSTDAVAAIGYRNKDVAGRKLQKYRPAWHGSPEYRQVITRRINRDLAEGRQHDGRHITGRCGELMGRSCDTCTRDAVQLLRSWAEQNMVPPCIGEPARSYWFRADGPTAELWALVARVMVDHATSELPRPGAWFHCGCCGKEGIDQGDHDCAERRATTFQEGDRR